MDGMIFVAFFFPLILFTSILCSVLGFLFSLWAGFGEEIAMVIRELPITRSYIPSVIEIVAGILENPPMKKCCGTYLYPLFLNVVLVSTVMGTYSLGKVLYHNRGWKFAQPMRGGLRFVLLQGILWTIFSIALVMPWLSIEGIGLLSYMGKVGSSEKDVHSFGGLLVSSAALGMVAQSLVIVALMAFDSNSQKLSRKDLRSLEIGNWNWNKMFGDSSHKFWWLFIALQSSMALYSCALGFIAEGIIKDGIIRTLMLFVLVAVVTVAIALTNIVGGKWRYGEFSYHIVMPFRGGIIFSTIQALGWMMYAMSLLVVGLHLFELTNKATDSWSMITLGAAGMMGFVSQSLIALSLLVFDPDQAGRSLYVRKIEQLERKARRRKQAAGRSENLSESASTTGGEVGHSRSRSDRSESPPGSSTARRRRRSKTPSRRGRKEVRNEKTETTNQTVWNDLESDDDTQEFLSNTWEREGKETSQFESDEKWIIDRIIGKRRIPDVEHGFEFLVQWKAPPQQPVMWAMHQMLVSCADAGEVKAAIERYEKDQKSITAVGDEAVDIETKTAVQDVTMESHKNERGRSNGGNRTTEWRRKGLSPDPVVTGQVPLPQEEYEWEEFEDEMGNVFYYCVTTGETTQTLQQDALTNARLRVTPTSVSSN